MDRRNFLKTALSGAAVLTVGALASPEAEASAPVYLGRRRVQPFLDQDRVHVGVGRGRFRRISFNAVGNDVYVYDVRVDYTIGGAEHFNTRLKIGQGTSSRRLNLRYNKRFIQDVSFRYGKLPNGNGPAFVEVWGWR
ncbi:MAG: twin-arginine translocation signal domain-containing protein [Rhizobiales bacterium]|nr:twin-arginine translocation signal domain-containing protein [Hyphomicrobiales bacterium]